MSEVEMFDLGEMNYFFGLQFTQNLDYICIHQSKYANEILKNFYMENCKAVKTLLASNCKLTKDDGT